MPLSNIIMGVVNITTFLLSIPLIGGGIWLATRPSTECMQFLEWSIIGLGLFILIISLLGCLGAFSRVVWLLYIYLFIMFFIILLLLSFIVFTFMVTKDGPRDLGGQIDYEVKDYSWWLREQVENSKSWAKIESCIRDTKICRVVNQEVKSISNFYAIDLSSLQHGCCIPPEICGFTIMIEPNNTTMWTNPSNILASPDCSRWSNGLTDLCYACDSCRASVLANVKQPWRKIALLSVIVLVMIIVVYVIACCAFQNAQINKRHFLRNSQGWYTHNTWR